MPRILLPQIENALQSIPSMTNASHSLYTIIKCRNTCRNFLSPRHFLFWLSANIIMWNDAFVQYKFFDKNRMSWDVISFGVMSFNQVQVHNMLSSLMLHNANCLNKKIIILSGINGRIDYDKSMMMIQKETMSWSCFIFLFILKYVFFLFCVTILSHFLLVI